MENIMNGQSFDLTLEQEFQMRLVEESVEQMSREQMHDLLIQVSRLMMVKDNIIRNFMKQEILQWPVEWSEE
jgi:hypothetical protein